MHRRFAQRRPTVERVGGAPKIAGYAAVYYRPGDAGTEFTLFPGLVERLQRGCFDRAVKEDDVAGLYNHDQNILLARNTAHPTPTLRMSLDDTGLFYEMDTDTDDPHTVHVMRKIDRGEVNGSSFAFDIDKEQRSHDRTAKVDVRDVLAVKLFDVGPVVYPAYSGTSTGLRGTELELEKRAHERWKMSTNGLVLPQVPRLGKGLFLRRGTDLAAVLTGMISQLVTKEVPQGDVVKALASAAGTSNEEVMAVLDGSKTVRHWNGSTSLPKYSARIRARCRPRPKRTGVRTTPKRRLARRSFPSRSRYLRRPPHRVRSKTATCPAVA